MLAVVLAVMIFFPSFSGAESETTGELDGQALFVANKCNMCHSVPSVGIEAKVKSESMKGPDITKAAARFEPDDLAKFIRKQGQLEGNDHKKEFKGTDEELAAMVAWLQRLKAEG
jgi:cbb3-type cytochrome oxidase cytochrome c subunit